MNPKIIFLPHANIQYSQLRPDKRAWVIQNSYHKLFELVEKHEYKIAFEASGQTLDVMAEKCPETMAKLKKLIQKGLVEPVGSPHTHIMISNIDPEICLDTLKDGILAWERHTGVRPETGWNPECGWTSYVPDLYKEAGFKTLVMDADSFMLSFEEIRAYTGLKFDVTGHSNKNKLFKIEEYIKDKPQFLKYITNPSKAKNGLNLIFRSDMMSNFMLWYLMGATEEMRDKPIAIEEIREMLARWKDRVKQTGTFIMPYAEDAEYIGTSAYFYVKQFGQARFFEPEPDSIKRFQGLLDAARADGYELSNCREVIQSAATIIKDAPIENIENGVAWHGGTGKAWANTKYARIFDPVCYSVFLGIKSICAARKRNLNNMDELLRQALKKLTSAYVSDSRWPPDPVSPGRFNVQESIADLYAANDAIRKSMAQNQLSQSKALYSPDLMQTQIAAIEAELMKFKYFGE